MAGVGSACLAVALLTALYAVAASVYGARSGRREWITSGRRAIYCVAALCVVAFGMLESAFLRSDFSFALVAEGSSTDTPTFYKVTALWATQDGSLLLWATLLSLFASAVLFLTRRSLRDIAPYATAVLGVVGGFFLLLMVGWENPFDTLAMPPAEGAGLNPLLRHPAMMIHPPMLYTGYVGFSIPFAFAIGALIARRTGADWIRATRRFALIAWTFLGTGIMLGALWSYTELGWGGYWAWDPVENASLMPWLVGTAFLHSIMVQEKRGMLKVWNVSLICATFTLALMGTFLVRSGILESIHAFGASTIGVQFLVFIGLVIAGSAALIIARLPDLRSEARLDSLLSREAFFLLNNLVLVGLCLVIMWGTFFPLISEAITGTEASVGPALVQPARRRRWRSCSCCSRRSARCSRGGAFSPSSLRRILTVPLAVVAVALVALLAFTDAADSPPSLAMFCLVAFVLAVVGQELVRGAMARRTMTGESLAARAGAAHRPQPAPLRRLPRARRHRGAVPGRGGVVGVPRPARRAPVARRVVRGGRLPGDLPRRPPPSSAATRPAPARRSRSARCSTCARTASTSCCGRRATTTRAATPRSARSRASSRARPPARSTCAGASRATSGSPCGPTSARSTGRSARPTPSSPTRPATCRR